jgi:hypothetical protein
MALLLLLGLPSAAVPTTRAALTYEEIVGKVLSDPRRLERTAELARLESEVASTGRFNSDGPTLEAELGPRRIESGATKLEAVARVEVPLLSSRSTRADADELLRSSRSDVLAADAIESRLRLRTAYLDAWLAQERLAVLDAQSTATAQIVASVRERVEEGAEASYEVALVEGELLRLGSAADEARALLADAWGRLRAAADLPADPEALASPGLPILTVPDDARDRFEAGVLWRTVSRRFTLQSAFVDLDQARRGSRWSVAGTLGKEGDEAFAIVGAAYRFPSKDETQARRREREATVSALDRGSQAESARLDTLFRATLDRVRRFGPIVKPDTLDDALYAIGLRMELGKERPSLALPVRRQILESQGAALQRIRDAHVLIAELDALTAGEAP